MPEIHQFTSIQFRNYKALKRYSVSLSDFNVLVGPNNAGKSTIIGAFRILSEGMRKASAKKPQYIPQIDAWGYRVPLEDLPIATENIFSDYDDSRSAVIDFRLSSGNRLELIFPETDVCYLICRTKNREIRSPSDFRREYRASVGFVPILGPVEHNEFLFQKEAARMALLTHRASRNFRNIWHHYPDGFETFQALIRSTWPGMDIQAPEVDFNSTKAILHMFCPEERFPREIYWAGFGFQVWCQMLTYIVRAKDDSLLIIDEPDIYLHSDLQRQLVNLLKNLGPDILLATHSTEIISEADPGDLLVINKKEQSAKRIQDLSQLQSVFSVLGSNLNPILTQLAKSRRAIFVEGKDFQILSAFARKLGKQAVANRSDFAVIPLDGYNPQRFIDFCKGMEMTLGSRFLKAVILDRDYRAEDEIGEDYARLKKNADMVHIHSKKEIENYLLDPAVIDRAIKNRILEHNKRTDAGINFDEEAPDILGKITAEMKSRVFGQFLSKRTASYKIKNPGWDQATISQKILDEFEAIWSNLSKRLEVIPGKEVFSELNKYLQEYYKVSLSAMSIINVMYVEEIPSEIKTLIINVDDYRKIQI